VSNNRKTWLIRPHDPLIFRDGRPFGPTPGARAHSLAFPFPSTTAGGVRTQAKTNAEGIFDLGTNDKEKVEKQLTELKALQIYGPLLVETADREQRPLEPAALLVPAPLDALLLQPKKSAGQHEVIVSQLVPLQDEDGALADLPLTRRKQEEKASHPFYLVGQAAYVQNKPFSGAPRYWYWERFLRWLEEPQALKEAIWDARQLGHNGPEQEQRVHVGIDSSKRSGLDGALFDTHGMEFHQEHRLFRRGENSPWEDAKAVQRRDLDRLSVEEKKGIKWNSYIAPLALAVAVESEPETTETQLRAGLNCFGGERRIVSWKSHQTPFPPCPDTLKQCIVERGCCRLILLTPGYFADLLRPEVFGAQAACQIQLRALATQRPQVVSGYDMALKQRKQTRRLAPAGTVFYLDLRGNDKATIAAWIERTWMRNVSDGRQECLDGFGLAVLGTWSGDPEKLVIKEKQA